MLKQRIVTAIALLLVLLFALTASNPLVWSLLIVVVLCVAFWEWLRFCGISELLHQSICFVLFAGGLGVLYAGLLPTSIVTIATCVLWAVLLLATFTSRLTIVHQPWVKVLVGIWVLSVAGYLVIELKSAANGLLWILCLMVSVWAADIGAYFVGRRFGKTKLAPSISPGKTVEGLMGGLVFVLVIFVPLFSWNFDGRQIAFLLLTVVVTALVSVGGDLFESSMKRFSGLKDSSQILPGHGGVLDRIDSLLAGVPFFVLGLSLLGEFN